MNENLNCLIVDDEPLARDLLKKHIAKIPFLNLIGECSNAVDALNMLNKFDVQLLFVDIEMPTIDGLTFTKSLTGHVPHLVFTTAYSEYAAQAFDRDAVDYLLKPITFERFLQAINKVLKGNSIRVMPPKQGAAEVDLTFPGDSELTNARKDEQEENDILLIKENKKYIKVNFKDIVYVEGMKDYIKVILKTDRTIITHMTMIKMENMLPANTFVRINRSYIINKNAIKFVDGNMVETTLGNQLIIGVNYRDMFRTFLKEGKF